MNALPDPIRDVVLQLEAGLKALYGDRYRGLLLFGSYADFDSYQRGGTSFLRTVRKEAIPVAA